MAGTETVQLRGEKNVLPGQAALLNGLAPHILHQLDLSPGFMQET